MLPIITKKLFSVRVFRRIQDVLWWCYTRRFAKQRRNIVATLVSLRNRTAERGGRQIACTWRTWQGYNLRILSWSWLTSMFSGLLQKDLFKRKWSLAKSYFKQNYCHACHKRFAVFFPLPSCCVSSLMANWNFQASRRERFRRSSWYWESSWLSGNCIISPLSILNNKERGRTRIMKKITAKEAE